MEIMSQALPFIGQGSLLPQPTLNAAKLEHPVLIQAKALEERMRSLRRTIHANPELSFEEFETSRLAAGLLEELGFEVRLASNGTGLIADIGVASKRTVAIKTELDALPVSECNVVSYRSRKANIMHACGHDAHIAAVLGAAQILSGKKLDGRLRIIMQAGEHAADSIKAADPKGKQKGSQTMIAEGALESVDSVLGFHVDTTTPLGQIGVVESPFLNLHSSFEIGLAQCFDTMQSTSKILNLLLQTEAENNRYKILDLQAAENSARIRGIFFGEEQERESQIQTMHEICRSAAKDAYELKIESNQEKLGEHKEVINLALNSAIEITGAEKAKLIKRRTWTKEFAEYAARIPGAFFLIGAQIQGTRTIQHSPSFDLDERVMPLTAAVLAQSVIDLLAQ